MRRHILSRPLAVVVAGNLTIGLMAWASAAAGASSAAGLSGESAKQIVAAVARTEGSVRSLHLHGVIHEKADTIAFTLDVRHSGDGTGTFTEEGQTIQLIKIGSALYLRANTAFWKKSGDPQLAQQVGDKWVKTSTADANFGSLAQFFGVSRLTTQLFPSGAGPVTKGAPVTADGYKTIPLTATVGENGTTDRTTLYVAAKGAPYVVKATAKSGNESGTITYSRYGETVKVKAPPKPIDLSKLTGGATTTTAVPSTTTTG